MKEMLAGPARSLVKGLLARLGYRLVPLTDEGARYVLPSHSGAPVPDALARELRDDNPRLVELRRRYALLRSPLALGSIWSDNYLRRELTLPYFRGDNAYAWQYRDVGADAARGYYLYARYVAERDPRGLLRQLAEDGAFGCHTFRYERFPPVSRDLLDSVNELTFLDRSFGLFQRPGLRALDIGAGYGRFAHRIVAALPDLGHIYCTDAVAESTFVCESYLRHRRCLDRATAVPLDELDRALDGVRLDLAVNIHSFSEMPRATAAAWIEWLARRSVPHLLVVPNDRERLLSWEADRSRTDLTPVLAAAGYALKHAEPVIADKDIRELTGIDHWFLLFERKAP